VANYKLHSSTPGNGNALGSSTKRKALQAQMQAEGGREGCKEPYQHPFLGD